MSDFLAPNRWQHWCKTMSNLLTKKHYFNVVNLNILLSFNICYEKFTDLMFNVLKQHAEILKHQFRQFNFGLQYGSSSDKKQCNVIEWNCNIDEKWLDVKQKKWNKWNQLPSEFTTNQTFDTCTNLMSIQG